jgi:hypothetical protein
MKGTVAPSSINFMAAETCAGLAEISAASRCSIFGNIKGLKVVS